MISKLQISTEFVASLESTYLAKVSIEMADTSNQFNEVMKKLSLTATILLPLTFLTGLFGMNIQVPWQTPGDGTGTLDAFYGIIGFMLFFSTACSIAFKLMFKD
jgi:Mg2+ and Co2+ transporter CorA